MNEIEKAYFKKLRLDLLKEKNSSHLDKFAYPLMPLQYSYVHNHRTGKLEHVQGVDRVLGYQCDEFTLDLYYDKLHPIDRKLIFTTSIQCIDSANEKIFEKPFGAQFTVLFRIKAKNGKYVHILRQSTILEYEKKLERTFSVCTDVTALGLTYKMNSSFFLKEHTSLDFTQLRNELIKTKWKKLTPREFEVLQLIAEGNTTKQIGEKLNISNFTVNKHRQNIINKTSTGNIQELLDETFKGRV
ncbi:LuxR C-terminal-related transcriptional regulator [uncultured Draconibacterium sp.]|uniref:LuxR C-terminal-related transcriptional regulator n=1 Tax=uncultured Draconibacterium sp. TaxID=1573823 RepID=UPI0029C8582F|nr:LuxR C-terminal-related transcriptional regulator [uncultured Draconibacterium sp.]